MKSWLIFKHSIRQVTGNWRVAVGLALPAILITFLLDAFISRDILFLSLHDLQQHAQDLASTDQDLKRPLEDSVAALLKMIVGLWLAVTWHRFVLLHEVPTKLPRFRGMRMLMYFLKSLLIMLPAMLCFAVILSPMVIASIYFKSFNAHFSGTPGALIFILIFCLMVAAVLVTFRLSTLLPGAALGQPISMRETWKSTSGQTGVFAGIAIVYVLCGFLILLFTLILTFVSQVLTHMPMIVLLGWQTIVVNIQVMVFLLTLTTLYGHYIEKRPLVS